MQFKEKALRKLSSRRGRKALPAVNAAGFKLTRSCGLPGPTGPGRPGECASLGTGPQASPAASESDCTALPVTTGRQGRRRRCWRVPAAPPDSRGRRPVNGFGAESTRLPLAKWLNRALGIAAPRFSVIRPNKTCQVKRTSVAHAHGCVADCNSTVIQNSKFYTKSVKIHSEQRSHTC
jgi:hypothetical protein